MIYNNIHKFLELSQPITQNILCTVNGTPRSGQCHNFDGQVRGKVKLIPGNRFDSGQRTILFPTLRKAQWQITKV